MKRGKYGIGKPALLGYLSLFAMIGGIGTWSVSTQIAGAVVAGGVVEVQGDRKAVQHPDGGVVEQILVSEGQVVEAGEVLLRLDDRKQRSELAVLNGQLHEILARKARLLAEQHGADRIEFTPELHAAAEDFVAVREIMAGESQLFAARRDTRQKEIAQLSEKRQQVIAEIEGTVSQLAAMEEQRDLLILERDDQQSLLDKGLTQRGRVLALRREVARLSGLISELKARIAQLRGQVAEMGIEELRLEASMREEATKSLRDLEFNESSLRERRTALLETIHQLELRAPTSGIVYDLRANAPSSVVKPAEIVMFVVPNNEELVVTSRIEATDIDEVFVGQSAVMVFPAFSQREAPEMRGTVSRVSADAFADEKTGEPFFEVQLSPESDFADGPNGISILPGMPVQSFIMTSERTPLSYLLKPFTDYFNKALRES